MINRYIDKLMFLLLAIVVVVCSYQIYKSIDIENELVKNPLYINGSVVGYDTDANGNSKIVFTYNLEGVEYTNTNYMDCRYIPPKIGEKIVIKASSKYPDCSRVEHLSSGLKDCDEDNVPQWILDLGDFIGIK